MKYLSLLLILLLSSNFLFADKICGRVLAENGLNIRTKPGLDGKVIHKLDQGDTFVYYSDGNTGKFLEIKDGNETLRGEWIEIILYPKLNQEHEEDKSGYIFFHPRYAEDDIECGEFRHRLFTRDLYEPFDGDASYLHEESFRENFELSFADETLFNSLKDTQKKWFDDKNSDHFYPDGKEGYPQVSPKGIYVFDIVSNYPYGYTSSFQLFVIEEDGINPVLSYGFANWIYEDEMVWVSDTEAILKVSASAAYRVLEVYADGSKNKIPDHEQRKIQFVRIKFR